MLKKVESREGGGETRRDEEELRIGSAHHHCYFLLPQSIFFQDQSHTSQDKAFLLLLGNFASFVLSLDTEVTLFWYSYSTPSLILPCFTIVPKAYHYIALTFPLFSDADS